MFHVFDDANDLPPERFALNRDLRLDALADRVFVREIALGESLIDDQDSRTSRVVAFGESAAGEQRNLHHVEIIETDRAEMRAGQLAFRNLPPFDLERSMEGVTAQWLRNDGAHRLDAGHRLQAINQLQ